jgi:hypothetical protein
MSASLKPLTVDEFLAWERSRSPTFTHGNDRQFPGDRHAAVASADARETAG